MEETEASVAQAVQPPPAEIVGLQFGLATAKDFIGFSVLERGCKDSLTDLTDPRLGIPAEDEKCATCGGTNYDECAGHFAHVKLTQPIFHPNHLRLVQRILQKVCLACGVPKPKKMKITKFSKEAGDHWKQSSTGNFKAQEGVNWGREHQAVVFEAEPIEKCDARDRGLIVDLTSHDDGKYAGILRLAADVPHGPMDFRVGSSATSQSVVNLAIPPSGKNNMSKGKAHANGSSPHFEVTSNGTVKSAKKTARSLKSQFTQSLGEKSSVTMHKGRPAGFDVLDEYTLKTGTPYKSSTSSSTQCVHCSPDHPQYRSILVKILAARGTKKESDVSEVLLLEVQPSKKEEAGWLPDDFWAFLGGPAHLKDKGSKVPIKHVLTPSEALAIFKKIPERAIGKLGMHRLVARPEGLIMKCVPIPPNCTRTTGYKYVSNMTAVRFGSDNVTRTLQSLVAEITRIQRTRLGKATNKAQRDESTALQILTAQYLREKGAPKAVQGNSEPVKTDYFGRITKQDDRRWTKEWLSEHLLAKGGNYTAKAVVAGDPSLSIDEIGVPWEIAQRLTLPEKATRWNCTKLQEYVTRSQTLDVTGSSKPGVTRIERNGEAFQVFSDSTHIVQIGDVVHRNIQDGDYVYVNRPPSVHKHSVMALKVHIHYGLVMTVNPLVCSPFGADFDGDVLHIYVPQSLQAIAEVELLMAVPEQLISDYGGLPLLALTQDTLLAAHLLTTGKFFVDKASMDQLCVWSSKQPPEAAILKSPKGGPFWTGEQVFGLTLPAELNLATPDESILIQGGEITKWIDGKNLMRKDKESIASALCLQLGPLALGNYLNNAAGLLHAWLQVQGFSTGLIDFQVTVNPKERQRMLQAIFEEYYAKSMQESSNSVGIHDPEAHETSMGPKLELNPESLTKNVKFLEHAAQQIFRTRERDAENIVMKFAEKDNPLLLMVNSGSKGSRGKLLQQIAGMGLQLYKGKHFFPLSGSRRRPLMSGPDPFLDWWKDKGLVRSSLVDGLKPEEFFSHVVADRTGIFRKHIEVAQPGTLFKSLMLFLRDLQVAYDGSVRGQCGKSLVQFCYGGAEGVPRQTDTKKSGSSRNQFKINDSIGTSVGEAGGDQFTWDEDDQKRQLLSRLAGEPVGVLAATAISQPAYECMLDAPNLNGPFNPRPLELVQETLYPREKTDLKPIDRCVIIRLVRCLCMKPFCLEKKLLEVQAYLTKITLRTLTESSAIQFWNVEDHELAGPNGTALQWGSPWLGHIKLSLDKMQQQKVTVEDIVQRLCEKFSPNIKNPKKHPMGQIFFCSSLYCSVSDGCCLHFSPRIPKKLQGEQDDNMYNEVLLTLLMKIRATIIPGLLNSTVKGDERLQSVRIVREERTRTTWHTKLHPTWYHDDLEEELVLEILVSPTKSRSNRGMAWAAVKQACVPFMDTVDWNRSMPYSIQEIRHTLGIEAAYEIVARRLGLVLEVTAPHTHHKHERLIADTMTFSGDANGFTIHGFQDMIKVTAVSAPFTEASFRKPIGTLLDAAERGATDSVEGVMTNCVWGKEAPLGTGSRFAVLWQPSKEDQQRVATSTEAERDVHMIWKDLDGKCIPDGITPLSQTHSLPPLHIFLPEGSGPDIDDGANFSPQHGVTFTTDDGEDNIWGNSPSPKNNGVDEAWGNPSESLKEDGGGGGGSGWGGVDNAGNGNDQGGWDQDEVGKTDGVKSQGEVEEHDDWGALGKEKLEVSGNDWNEKSKEINIQSGQNSSEDLGGWGSVNRHSTEGNNVGTQWGPDPVLEESGGRSCVSTEVAEGDGWSSIADSQTASASVSEHTGTHNRGVTGGYEKNWSNSPRGKTCGSGAKAAPLGIRRQVGTSQADPEIALGGGLPQDPHEVAKSTGWDDPPDTGCLNFLLQPSDKAEESGVDWGGLVSGVTKAESASATNNCESSEPDCKVNLAPPESLAEGISAGQWEAIVTQAYQFTMS